MFAGVEASGEPEQMNDADLGDGDLISGLFCVPLWVNRRQNTARVCMQRKLKVKVTCSLHFRQACSIIAASYPSVVRNEMVIGYLGYEQNKPRWNIYIQEIKKNEKIKQRVKQVFDAAELVVDTVVSSGDLNI